MSRKQASFGSLLNYMEDGREDSRYTIKHNLYTREKEKIKKEFEHNASFFRERKNGVYLYHEILSITRSKTLNKEQQKEYLHDIAQEYIKERANDNLVYAVLHDDKEDNLHYHLMISSNKFENEKKHRLSKEEFDKVKKDLENHVLEKYPELEQAKIINQTAKEKYSNKGAELKRRTGKTPQRDSVKDRLKTVFGQSKDKADFFHNMDHEKLEIYIRGKNIGVIDKTTGRRHRLKTLGMQEEFNKVSAIIETSQKTEKESKKDKFKEKSTNQKAKPQEQSEREKIINSRKEELKNSRASSTKSGDSSKNFNR